MQVHTRGDGEPTISIVGSIHGDEPAGKNAIEHILEENLTFNKPVQFVIANEEALAADKRYLDVDLNRNFPGDPDSDTHEQRLAAELVNVLQGTRVLDLHTTHSYPEPFGIIKSLDEAALKRVQATGVENVIYFPNESGSLIDAIDGIVVETGHQHTDEAMNNAIEVIKRYLGFYGVIDYDAPTVEQDFYQYTATVEGSGWEFTGENFIEVEQGEVFARKGSKEKRASEAFYPILMSTNGYEDQIGFQAKKITPRQEI
ncbi:MAG: succinylglutamate desuccinylase/aspartoacylase family protein [Candidatus Nanohaloarchaeota archaeon QJJ-5]|nr:succinylglutamate desuccinylase/aspartoacylase family protein [Candidatus Nanohaloarchaeota archaeon QJJ-5]